MYDVKLIHRLVANNDFACFTTAGIDYDRKSDSVAHLFFRGSRIRVLLRRGDPLGRF